MSLKRGNLIRFKTSFWGGSLGESQENVGKLGVIEYSYGEKYGNGTCSGGYSVIDYETGSSSSWWNENQLEFIEEGGEHLIKECERKSDEGIKMATDLTWIKDNFDSGNISSASILKLFDEIGYSSTFNRNGEFFVLFDDWNALSPIFTNIFNDKLDDALEYVNKIFRPGYRKEYENNIKKFYEKIKCA
jgi:hypothetical protein